MTASCWTSTGALSVPASLAWRGGGGAGLATRGCDTMARCCSERRSRATAQDLPKMARSARQPLRVDSGEALHLATAAALGVGEIQRRISDSTAYSEAREQARLASRRRAGPQERPLGGARVNQHALPTCTRLPRQPPHPDRPLVSPNSPPAPACAAPSANVKHRP